jgi:hypothetical protein
MKKQLEQMSMELKDMMIYQAPPELGALWTETNEMMTKIGKEQKVLIAIEMKKQAIADARRAARMKRLRDEAIFGFVILVIIFAFGGMMMWVAWDRQQKYPQYGTGLFPHDVNKTEPTYTYIGR